MEVQPELTRYLDDNWVPVFEQDVDGPASLPLQLDRENSNFGRYSAVRRVARCLCLGTAPKLRGGNPGITDQEVKLGSAQPGETVATFGDALRRLSNDATHLYVNEGRYWFDTKPSVNRLATERATQLEDYLLDNEIVSRLRAVAFARGETLRVHACPSSGGDVPDERETRLVVLGPDTPHASRNEQSPARAAAAAILARRGETPRRYANALVFLAPDRARLDELKEATRLYLAWKQIYDEREPLNLDPFQQNQAKSKRDDLSRTVDQRISETFYWLFVPGQELRGQVSWNELRLQGNQADETLGARTLRRLRSEGLIADVYGPTNLRNMLDEVPLWRGDHITVRDLVDFYAQYLYLQRLTDPEKVIPATIGRGVGEMLWASETFAYAERYDAALKRYFGLKHGMLAEIPFNDSGVVVRPEAVPADEGPTGPARTTGSTGPTSGTGSTGSAGTTGATGGQPALLYRRFHGNIELSPTTLASTTSAIAEAIVQHLAGHYGAEVRLTLEIQATFPDGASEHIVRTVTENARTLGVRARFELE